VGGVLEEQRVKERLGQRDAKRSGRVEGLMGAFSDQAGRGGMGGEIGIARMYRLWVGDVDRSGSGREDVRVF